MSHPHPVVSYRALLAMSGLRLVFAAASLTRLSYATLILSLLLAVQTATGSYAVAGTALGVYGITSFTMPAKARLLDTLRPRRVLPLLSALFVSALTVLAAAASNNATSAPVYLAGAAAAGLVAPPVGPTMRAVWARLTPEPAARQRAYSLDAVVESGLFAAGPVLAAATVDLASPATALLGTAATHLLGSLVMATSPLLSRAGDAHRGQLRGQPPAASAGTVGGASTVTPVEPPAASRLRRALGPLARPGYIVLLVFTFAIGLGNDPLELAAVARGQQSPSPATSGLLLAVLSLSAAVSGLAWGQLVGSARGRRLSDASPWVVLAGLAAVTSIAATGAALLPGLAWLTVALIVVGAASAPLAVVIYTAADGLSALEGGSEATTWVNTAANLGASLGTAAAGVLIDALGINSAFGAGAAIAAAAALGAWIYHLRDHASTRSVR